MRLNPVRDHKHLVHGEKRRQLGLVGLELLPSGSDGRVFVYRILELNHPEWQAVDKQHHVEPAVVLILCDGELVDR